MTARVGLDPSEGDEEGAGCQSERDAPGFLVAMRHMDCEGTVYLIYTRLSFVGSAQAAVERQCTPRMAHQSANYLHVSDK